MVLRWYGIESTFFSFRNSHILTINAVLTALFATVSVRTIKSIRRVIYLFYRLPLITGYFSTFKNCAEHSCSAFAHNGCDIADIKSYFCDEFAILRSEVWKYFLGEYHLVHLLQQLECAASLPNSIFSRCDCSALWSSWLFISLTSVWCDSIGDSEH